MGAYRKGLNMLSLYGSPRSSAGRCFWCLEEIGVGYQNIAVDMKNKEHKSESFLKLNPNGKVPLLVDGDLVLFESMAINFYLAEKYKPSLLGTTSAEKALTHQWSFWALSELQDPLIQVLIQKIFVPDDKKDQNLIERKLSLLPDLFSVLQRTLLNRKYLAGDDFTLADLNTGSVVQIAAMIGYDLSPFPAVKLWLAALEDRPASKRVQLLV